MLLLKPPTPREEPPLRPPKAATEHQPLPAGHRLNEARASNHRGGGRQTPLALLVLLPMLGLPPSALGRRCTRPPRLPPRPARRAWRGRFSPWRWRSERPWCPSTEARRGRRGRGCGREGCGTLTPRYKHSGYGTRGTAYVAGVDLVSSLNKSYWHHVPTRWRATCVAGGSDLKSVWSRWAPILFSIMECIAPPVSLAHICRLFFTVSTHFLWTAPPRSARSHPCSPTNTYRQAVLAKRIASTAASVYANTRPLPSELNPILRPLVSAVKKEPDMQRRGRT